MTIPLILFYTAGVTDLQALIRRADGFPARAVLDKGAVRAFHEALREGRLTCLVEDDPAWRDVPEVRLGVAMDPDTGEFTLDDDICFLRDGEGAPRLFPAKLATLYRALDDRDEAGEPRYRLLAAVGFFTHRRHREGEPVALETLLPSWIAARLAPDIPTSASRAVVYLQGEESSPGRGRDAPFHREAAARIEVAIRDVRRAAGDAPVIALAHLEGGLPGSKEVVLAALELHFDKVSRNLAPDDRERPRLAAALPPHEGLRARRLARDFVRRGALVEAAAVAEPFRDDEADRDWARPLADAALLLTDNPLRRYAESPPPHLPAPLAALARHWRLRAWLPALRTELALASERWLEAINSTLTFFDAALLDAIGRYGVLDDRAKRFRFRAGSHEPRLLDAADPSRLACLRPRGGGGYEYYTGGSLNQVWLEVLGCPRLAALDQALRLTDNHGRDVARFRNLNIHTVLGMDELEQARALFRATGLWNPDAPADSGARFLGQPLVAGALQEAGVPAAADACRALLADLVRRLEHHRIR